MNFRLYATMLLVAVAEVSLAGQSPRTPDGHPDLQGIWTNATLTPMERPAVFAGKATVSDAEAKAYEKNELDVNDIDKPNAPLLERAGPGLDRQRWAVTTTYSWTADPNWLAWTE